MTEPRGTIDRDQIASRALAALRTEGPAAPPPGLAARAAAHALAAEPPALVHELFASVAALVRPAAALGCAAALMLGVAHASTRDDARSDGSIEGSIEGRAALDLTSALGAPSSDDAVSAVLPFSITASQGGAR